VLPHSDPAICGFTPDSQQIEGEFRNLRVAVQFDKEASRTCNLLRHARGAKEACQGQQRKLHHNQTRPLLYTPASYLLPSLTLQKN
jgi:hypothetical protein